MLTARGWWLLLIALFLVSVAGLVPPPRGNTSLALIGLTLLLWFIAQWVQFGVRTFAVRRRLVLHRELHDDRGPVKNLWAGRSFTVRLSLRPNGWLNLPYAILNDRLPFGVEQQSGETRWQGVFGPEQPAEVTYRIHCPTVGTVRFEGVKVELTDLQGFFYSPFFLGEPKQYRVLPPLVDAEAHNPTTKRQNLLPPPGSHRHRRPGSGAELLDLRDYLPGDPPKMIAWKVSARRDRLITKEFESEVPVRCTLFLDTSNSVRLGPQGRNALAREVEIAAAVAQAAVAARDQVGFCLFDEATAEYIKPARTPRHLIQALNRLADAAGLAPAQGRASVESLVPAAYAFVEETYPQLLRPAINSFPWWLAWISPPPTWTLRRPRFRDYVYHWLPVLFVAWGVLGLLLLVALLFVLRYELNVANPVFASEWAVFLMFGISAPLALILTWFAVIPARAFFPQKRRLYRWRKQLAAVLSVRYHLTPGGLSGLLEDPEQFSAYLQRFLADHHVPYALPLYDARGRYLFASPEKAEVLARSILRAVSQSHDNELFVLLADLLELGDSLGPLLRAVKVAVARHHQVLIVCPWPPGLPLPAKGERSNVLPLTHVPVRPVAGVSMRLVEVLEQATTVRFHEAFYKLRRSMARVGVPVLCAEGDDPAPLIVERLDRLRTMRSAPRT